MTPPELPDYVARNRAYWSIRGRDQESWGRSRWTTVEILWGLFGVPEDDIRVLPGLYETDVIELGCGTAYFSAWMARRGARAVGVDISPDQLERASAFQREFELEFPLIEANAEEVPLSDDSFDLVLSEYGASTWCDPRKWVPEATRLLRPGGRLVFLRSSTLSVLCSDDRGRVQEQLERPQLGLYRIDWAEKEGEGSEFQFSHEDWIDVLRESGLEVVRLVELYAPPGASTSRYWSGVSVEWAARWPAEEIWVARKP
ncbi:MAG: class I SAM-dependent methyltransferase [Gaiellaceae bacterium]|jgi:SAM-dependent methyltransferase